MTAASASFRRDWPLQARRSARRWRRSRGSSIRMRFADLDAVTLDAHGTLVDLLDPVPALRRALAGHGFDADDRAVGRAFAAEVAYYRPRGSQGRDEASLRRLREECVAVF